MSNDLSFLPVVMTIVFLILAIFIVVFSVIFQRRQLENMLEKQALQKQFQQATLQAQIEIQNQTLEHIGQEIHDDVGQTLTVVRLYLNSIEEANNQPDIQKQIEKTNEFVEQALQKLRSLSKSFDGFSVKEFGLVSSVDQELKRIGLSKKFKTALFIQGEPYSLGFQSEIILFRIIQEVFNNAIKHSASTQIDVKIIFDQISFLLEIIDNGIGFNYEQIMNRSNDESGSGLRNLQRRAELLGGKCTIISQQGSGTVVRINITLKKSNEKVH